MADFSSLLKPNPFAGDAGEIEPKVQEALAAPIEARSKAVIEALGRVLVGAVPHADPGREADGSVAEHEKVSGPLDSPEGLIRVNFAPSRKAIAVFSSAQTYNAFSKKYQLGKQVRPVPVAIKDAAVVALAHGDGLLVLDPGESHQQWIGRSAVTALAAQQPWVAPWEDSEIREHILASIHTAFDAGEKALGALQDVQIEPGEGGATVVALGIDRSATRTDVEIIVGAISDIVAMDSYVKARLDVVELRPMARS